MPTLTWHDDVAVIDLGDGENRTSPEMLDELGARLGEVESRPGPRALVTTGSGRFFSNGLDVEWMAEHPDAVADYVARNEHVLARLLSFPAPTVAAVNGHAFGLGAFITATHDHVVMRADRGYLCWPEAALDMPLTRGLAAALSSCLSRPTAHRAITTSHRFTAADAIVAGIVHEAVPEADVRRVAIERAAALAGYDGVNVGGLRRQLHAAAVDLLEAAPAT